MTYLKKVIYSLGISIGIFVFLTLIITLLSYFNIISSFILKIFKIIIPFISLLFGGIYLGKKSNSKGYLEGIKFGLIFIIITFFFTFLAFNKQIAFNDIFIYSDILLGSIIGSMIGINMKKTD